MDDALERRYFFGENIELVAFSHAR